ncbi:hypothetical protein GOV12_06655 [Candidatus Pacearchaeota archaeon]|nr:hypothetical protein [Candidatus Pacearchaeota archaeon]
MRLSKKAMSKLGASTVSVLIMGLIVLFLFIPVITTSEVVEGSEYYFGEKVKIDLSGFNDYKLKIYSPSDTFIKEGDDESLIFVPQEVGKYNVEINSEGMIYEYEFIILDNKLRIDEDKREKENEYNSDDVNIKEEIEDWELNDVVEEESENKKIYANMIEEDGEQQNRSNNDKDNSDVSKKVYTIIDEGDDMKQEGVKGENDNSKDNGEIFLLKKDNESLVVVGRPVINKKEIVVFPNSKKVRLKIPDSSYNIKINEGGDEISYVVKEGFLEKIKEIFINDLEKTIEINDVSGNVLVEYELKGPEKKERELFGGSKEVVINSEYHGFKDIVSFSKIDESLKINDMDKIRIYWVEENIYLDFFVYDLDFDGYYDFIEWIVPHLSRQTFIIDFNSKELIENEVFLLGEKILIDVNNKPGYLVNIYGPSDDYNYRGTLRRISFEPSEVGEYEVEIIYNGKVEEISFNVVEEIIVKKRIDSDNLVEKIKVGEIVKIQDKIVINNNNNNNNTSNIFVLTDKNISVFKIVNGTKKKLENPEFIETDEGFMELILKENISELLIEYELDAPKKQERIINKFKKEVKVSSSDEFLYENVTSFSKIPEYTSNIDAIKVYWIEEGRYLDFKAFDNDGNGYYDYIEWIVPHLSEQTFEIIIITKAEHLNENREFIEDVYEEVKTRDGIFKEILIDNYIRVIFQKNLTNKNDITIYAKSNESGRVEVYEKDSDVKLADFGVINEDKKYRILLTELIGSQDVFDLKIIDGNIFFDLIIDPPATPTQFNYDDFEAGWGGWTDGGSDAGITANAHCAGGGGDCMTLQDNSVPPASTVNLTTAVDVSSYDYLSVSFTFNADNYEANTTDGIYLDFYNGSEWIPRKRFEYGTGIDNDSVEWFASVDTEYFEVVWINKTDHGYNFPINAKIRFRSYADHNNDDIYIDNVNFSGWIGTRPPNDPSPEINSTDGTNLSSQDLNCFDTLSDPNADSMNVTVEWYKNDVLDLIISYNNSYSDGELFNAVLDSLNTSVGENWSCGMKVYDLTNSSSWVNSSVLTIDVNYPPNNPSPEINSTDASNTTNQDLNCFDILSDNDGSEMNVTVEWYKNDVLDLIISYNDSYPNASSFNAVLDSGNTSVGENWSCGMKVYDATNSSSWVNSSLLSIIFDTIDPNGTLINPLNNSFVNNVTQNLTINATDNMNLSNATLYVYNSTGSEINMSVIAVTGTAALVGIVYEFLYDGVFQWFYRIFDFSGNSYDTGNYTITIDRVAPGVIINLPGNTTYDAYPVEYRVTLDEDGGGVLYSVDGGSNVTMATIDNRTYTASDSSVGNGGHIINFYANDSAGNTNYSEGIGFSVDISYQETSGGCANVVACYDNGQSKACLCSDIDNIDSTYFNGASRLRTKSSNLGYAVVNFTNSSLLLATDTIISANFTTQFSITSGMDYCQGFYSIDQGSTWSILENDCTGFSSETIRTYDLSGLSNDNINSLIFNFTVQEGSTSFKALAMNYMKINITYITQGLLSTTLNAPLGNAVLDNRTVTFNFTPATNDEFINCSLYENSTGIFAFSQVNQTPVVNGSYNFISKTFSSDGSYLWNVKCCDGNDCKFDPLNRVVTVDTTIPDIVLLEPQTNEITTSSYGVDFIYNVSDFSPINNCSLIIDNERTVIQYNVDKNSNQTMNYFMSNGLHNWSINCSDATGNENFSETRVINVSVPAINWDKRWFETSSGTNYTDTAVINLSNSRDDFENQMEISIDAGQLQSMVNSTTPYFGNNGALIPADSTITFSGYFSTDILNKEYITWKLYISNSSGDYMICQLGNDGVLAATKISSSGTYSGTCSNASDIFIQDTDQLRMVVNIYNDAGSSATVGHHWDVATRLSYVDIGNLTILGDLYVDMTDPIIDQAFTSGDNFTMNCTFNCSAGFCQDTDIYVQYNTSAIGWTDISGSGNIILQGSEINPHVMGNINSTITTMFNLTANAGSVNNIRCRGTSTYSNYNGTTTKQVTITAANQPPTVELTNPGDGSWTNDSDVILYYNVSDDNNLLSNCSLYINEVYNQSNSTTLLDGEINNFTFSGIGDGLYNWTVNCSDSSDNNGSDGPREFYIDTSFPTIELLFPEKNETINRNSYNFSINITDNLDSSLTCNLTVDEEVEDIDFEAESGNITNRTINDLSIGTHFWNVTCIDEALNFNLSETRNFTVQDLSPSVNLSSPGDEQWNNASNITLYYNATDNNELSNCSIYINGVYNQSNSTTILNGELNNFTFSFFDDGSYNWSVNCTDNGNLSTLSETWDFYIDTIPPSVVLNLPNNGTYTTSDIRFNFTVYDNLDDPLNCSLFVGGESDLDFSADNGTNVDRDINNLVDGMNYWNVTCSDEAGNNNISEIRFVNISEQPNVVLNTENNTYFNISDVTLEYTPSDNFNLSQCDLYINGAYNRTNSSAITNGAVNSFSLSSFFQGVYNWSVQCKDEINLTNTSEMRVFGVDTEKPSSVDLFYPDAGEIITFTNTILFNFSVVDNIDTNLSCNVSVDGIVENSTSALNGSYTIASVDFSLGGVFFWNVTCIDDANNLNFSETRNFTLSFPPVVNITSPDNDTWYNSSNIVLYYNASDGNDNIKNSSLIINGVENITNLSSILNGEINNFTITGWGDGKYDWSVNVSDDTDLTGNSSTNTFYIDSTPPNITLFFPNQSQEVTTNTVGFNYSVFDNLASTINCNLSMDGSNVFDDFNINNGENRINYTLARDGNHSWFVECEDPAGWYNKSETINFSVEAPPDINLTDPSDGIRTNKSTVTFTYTPYDPYAIFYCELILDGVVNGSQDNDIENGQPNYFTRNNLSEGYHNWTVQCLDDDSNLWSPNERSFYVDFSPPNISLIYPGDESGVLSTGGGVRFRWSANDSYDSQLRCNMNLDGVNNISNQLVTSGITYLSDPITDLSIGEHTWNVTCWDHDFLSNINNTVTFTFNFTYTDFFVNSTSLIFNNTNPIEQELISINATVYNSGGVDGGVIVQFYNGTPGLGGTQIDSDYNLTVLKGSQNSTEVTWNTVIGMNEIYVLVDPPLASNGSFDELNETNNNVSKNISISSDEFFYGSINNDSELVLAENVTNNSVSTWSLDTLVNGNIFAIDSESSISWTDLVAVGKNTSGQNTSDDFTEIDILFNTTGFNDSIYNSYTDSGNINNFDSFTIFNEVISVVPVVNSTNNSNFSTGILWDSDDDSDFEFDSIEQEDLIFVTKINSNSQGKYGLYDYEMRVPARLRGYKGPNVDAVLFYVELK